MRRSCLLALALLFAGCHWKLQSPGIDPKSFQLYFPTGLAIDPAGRYLYVTNGNADLRYSGSTLAMVDVHKFECTLARWRQLHPAHQDLRPVPGCGDLTAYQPLLDQALCRPDPLDPDIVDCDETPFMLPYATVRLGNFAGAVRLQHGTAAGADDGHRRLFTAVRGDPSVTWVDVHLNADSATDDRPGTLDCFDDPSSLTRRKGYDGSDATKSLPPGCDTSHLMQLYLCENMPNCVGDPNHGGLSQIPTEPFGMALDEPDPALYPAAGPRLVVAHTSTGQVSVFDLGQSPPALVTVSVPFFGGGSNLRKGAFALAPHTPGDPSSLWYMTSNLNPALATFRIAPLNGQTTVVPSSIYSLSNTFSNGADTRAILFDRADGQDRAFVTDNAPPSVVVLDTRPDPLRGGEPRNQARSVINVCQSPSRMGLLRRRVLGAVGAPPYVQTKLAVVCFTSSQVMLVDPDRPGISDTTISGLGGPSEMVFNFDEAGPLFKEQPELPYPQRGYVANFTESTLSVLDLDASSPTENRVIARLGFPPDGYNP